MDCVDVCQSGEATRGGGHDVPLLDYQFNHIAPLLISKVKWNDITCQVSFSFRTRLWVGIVLMCARAERQPAEEVMRSHCSTSTLFIARACVDSAGARCQTYLIFSKKNAPGWRASDPQTHLSTEEKARRGNARQCKACSNKARRGEARQGNARQAKPS